MFSKGCFLYVSCKSYMNKIIFQKKWFSPNVCFECFKAIKSNSIEIDKLKNKNKFLDQFHSNNEYFSFIFCFHFVAYMERMEIREKFLNFNYSGKVLFCAFHQLSFFK